MAKSYLTYTIERLIQAVPVLFGLSIVIFVLTRVVPGDPVRLSLGPTATQEQVEQVRAQMGLDQPVYIQYIEWLQGFFSADWGKSLRTGNNVYHDISTQLPATFELVLYAMLLTVVIVIPAGIIAGSNQNKWQDHLSRFVALFGVSMPRWWIAIILQILFFVVWSLFPLRGRLSTGVPPPSGVTHLYTIDALLAGQLKTFLDAVHHLILPVFALATGTVAQSMRLIRSDVIEQHTKDYIIAARIYGLPENLIRYKYIFKNSFTAALTVLGLQFGFLMGNAFLVELVFAWPGMARYGVNSILAKDLNAVIAVVMVVGVFFVFANLLVDLFYGYLDPRVRLEE